VSSFQEPLYCGHLGDLVECSCIERCPRFRNSSIVDTLGTWGPDGVFLYREVSSFQELLHCGHLGTWWSVLVTASFFDVETQLEASGD
jgi:hypothetical protein